MATKGNSKGRYLTKVGHYDIYGKDSFRPKRDGASKHIGAEVSSTEYIIYHAKKIVQKGFKTKDMAVDKANELMLKK